MSATMTETTEYSSRGSFLLMPVKLLVGVAKFVAFIVLMIVFLITLGFPVIFLVLLPCEIVALVCAVLSFPVGIVKPVYGKRLLDRASRTMNVAEKLFNKAGDGLDAVTDFLRLT